MTIILHYCYAQEKKIYLLLICLMWSLFNMYDLFPAYILLLPSVLLQILRPLLLKLASLIKIMIAPLIMVDLCTGTLSF